MPLMKASPSVGLLVTVVCPHPPLNAIPLMGQSGGGFYPLSLWPKEVQKPLRSSLPPFRLFRNLLHPVFSLPLSPFLLSSLGFFVEHVTCSSIVFSAPLVCWALKCLSHSTDSLPPIGAIRWNPRWHRHDKCTCPKLAHRPSTNHSMCPSDWGAAP